MICDVEKKTRLCSDIMGESEDNLLDRTITVATAPDDEIKNTGRLQRHVSSVDVLLRCILWTSVICAVTNCLFLVASYLTEGWLFGPVCCQLYGWWSQVLISTGTWMVALYSLERCIYYLMPTEHSALLSEVNTRILVYGVDLILLVLHTGPLYGWGEYSQYRGGLAVDIVMSDDISQGTSAVTNYTGSGTEVPTVSEFALLPNPDNSLVYLQILDAVIQNIYDCSLRTKFCPLCKLFIRCPNRDTFDRLMSEYTNNQVASYLDREVTLQSNISDRSLQLNLFYIRLDDHDVHRYSSVDLAIQDVGTCTLDWSSMNQAVISWIPIVVLTTTVIPLSISILSAVILVRFRHVQTSYDDLFPTCFICLTGSVLGLLSASVYYSLAALARNYVAVPRTFYILGCVLYYISPLWFSFLYFVTRCFNSVKK